MKLGLGTVQFGMNYGISNREGQTSLEEAKRILLLAARNGICVLDTAALYGTSEEVLGKTLPRNYSFAIVTKTPKFASGYITNSDARLLEDTFYQSLAKVGRSSFYGLLLHHADDLLAKNGHLLMERMLDFKQRGLVEKIGISVYTSKQLDEILDRYSIDLIQLPINVLDQRLLSSGHLSKIKKAGIEIHARSVFLQGLLLMSPDLLPSHLDSVREHLKNYHETIRQWRISPVQAALGFVAGLDEIDVVLCGMNNHRQLQELISQMQRPPVACEDFVQFGLTDEAILNPSMWRF